MGDQWGGSGGRCLVFMQNLSGSTHHADQTFLTAQEFPQAMLKCKPKTTKIAIKFYNSVISYSVSAVPNADKCSTITKLLDHFIYDWILENRQIVTLGLFHFIGQLMATLVH